MKRLAGLAVALLIAGCASAPKPRYYTIDMTPSGAPGGRYNIDVDRLSISEALARSNILVKKSPTEIEYYAEANWPAGLAEVVTHKLETEFGADVPHRRAILIHGTIVAFEQEDAPEGAFGHIRLDLNFRDASMSRYVEPLLKKTYERRIPAKRPYPAGVVEALSRGLEQIAAEIVKDADALTLPE